MPFAILRTAKLTSFANISGSARHNFREREVLNADTERTSFNRISGAQSTKEVLAAIKKRLETQQKMRKNAVLAVEYFIGASPEWFQDGDRAAIHEFYFDEAERWLKTRHGAENVISVTRQYDEGTPHMCAYVVPIDPKGKLNCSHFLDGRKKLSQMQTDFAEQVGKPLGLQRGIEGSKAVHQRVKRHYSLVNAAADQIDELSLIDKASIAIATPTKRAKKALGSAETTISLAHEYQARQKAVKAREEALKAQESDLRWQTQQAEQQQAMAAQALEQVNDIQRQLETERKRADRAVEIAELYRRGRDEALDKLEALQASRQENIRGFGL